MKKNILGVIIISLYYYSAFAWEPTIICEWLPWCDWGGSSGTIEFIGLLVAELIKYVAVVAVFALIAAWFMYIFSAGEDEKTKTARKWIMWSLIAVFISISGYFLINLINNATITL